MCCTGSNFLLRAKHAAEVGWFPTFTSEYLLNKRHTACLSCPVSKRVYQHFHAAARAGSRSPSAPPTAVRVLLPASCHLLPAACRLICCRCLANRLILDRPAVGEDVALALELQCRGHSSCYLHECLAVGEVPTSIRAICMQKSR